VPPWSGTKIIHISAILTVWFPYWRLVFFSIWNRSKKGERNQSLATGSNHHHAFFCWDLSLSAKFTFLSQERC